MTKYVMSGAAAKRIWKKAKTDAINCTEPIRLRHVYAALKREDFRPSAVGVMDLARRLRDDNDGAMSEYDAHAWLTLLNDALRVVQQVETMAQAREQLKHETEHLLDLVEAR